MSAQIDWEPGAEMTLLKRILSAGAPEYEE